MSELSAFEIFELLEERGVEVGYSRRFQQLSTADVRALPPDLLELLVPRIREVGSLIHRHGLHVGFYQLGSRLGYERPWHQVVVREQFRETACRIHLFGRSNDALTRELPPPSGPVCRRCVAAYVRREIDRDASFARAKARP